MWSNPSYRQYGAAAQSPDRPLATPPLPNTNNCRPSKPVAYQEMDLGVSWMGLSDSMVAGDPRLMFAPQPRPMGVAWPMQGPVFPQQMVAPTGFGVMAAPMEPLSYASAEARPMGYATARPNPISTQPAPVGVAWSAQQGPVEPMAAPMASGVIAYAPRPRPVSAPTKKSRSMDAAAGLKTVAGCSRPSGATKPTATAPPCSMPNDPFSHLSTLEQKLFAPSSSSEPLNALASMLVGVEPEQQPAGAVNSVSGAGNPAWQASIICEMLKLDPQTCFADSNLVVNNERLACPVCDMVPKTRRLTNHMVTEHFGDYGCGLRLMNPNGRREHLTSVSDIVFVSVLKLLEMMQSNSVQMRNGCDVRVVLTVFCQIFEAALIKFRDLYRLHDHIKPECWSELEKIAENVQQL